MPFIQRQLGGDGSFGPTLQELRELRGFSREELSEQTRIHVSVIAALEEERIEDLTDPQYAERHVRAIVSVLEGRLAYFLPKYRELLMQKKAGRSTSFSVRPTVRRRDFVVFTRFFALGGFLLLVGLSAFYLVWQAHLLQDPPPLTIQSPIEGEELSSPSLDVRGATVPGAVVTINGKKAVVDPRGDFALTFDIPRGLTTLTIIAQRRYGSSVTETRRVTYQHSTTTTP